MDLRIKDLALEEQLERMESMFQLFCTDKHQCLDIYVKKRQKLNLISGMVIL